jgi:16S rRNA (adenine1518-N6/adenine1519-N6)-dimethyltransferase
MWRDMREVREGTKEKRKSTDEISFACMAFTVQWEVALRMAARPDTRDFGPLGVLIQAMADVEIVRKIPPGAFWPPPKVHSALVVVTPVAKRIGAIADAPALQALLAGIFSHRRQTLGNALKHYLGPAWQADFKRAYAAEGFDLLKRPETFSVGDLLHLQRVTAALNPPPPRGGDNVPPPAEQITKL